MQGDCFGDQRLVDLAERHCRPGGATTCANASCDEVHAFAGDAAQHDDMTMVLVKIS